MFDPKKPFATCGMGQRIFYQQDGVYYNPSTKEPVDLSTLPKPTSKTPTPVPAPAAPPAPMLACAFCGAQRATPELFKEHLLAVHADKVGPLLNSAPAETPSPEPEPDTVGQQEPESIAQPKSAAKSKPKGK